MPRKLKQPVKMVFDLNYESGQPLRTAHSKPDSKNLWAECGTSLSSAWYTSGLWPKGTVVCTAPEHGKAVGHVCWPKDDSMGPGLTGAKGAIYVHSYCKTQILKGFKGNTY